MPRVSVDLPEPVFRRLVERAVAEKRDPRAQGAWMLERALIRTSRAPDLSRSPERRPTLAASH